MTELIPILVIIGATAVGKTAAAIKLAKGLNGEIVSVDSRYFYRGMDIGTAKPSLMEQQGIPHHLVDIANPDEIISLGIFRKMADEAIRDIYYRKKLPILVGGTGQYIRAVVEGWSVPEVEPHYALRNYFQSIWDHQGAESVVEWLKKLDPQACKQVDTQNPRRVIRALEVIYSSGRLFSEQRIKIPPIYSALQIGLFMSREKLYRRADERVDWMLENGFVDEVSSLIKHGFDINLPSMTAIGYYELCAYLHGRMTLSESVYKIKMRTHNFIRKQSTWFRTNDPSIHWVDMNENPGQVIYDLAQIHISRK